MFLLCLLCYGRIKIMEHSIPPSHAQCSLRIIVDNAVLDEQLRELNNTLKTFMQDMAHEAVQRNDESLIKYEMGSISV